MSQTKENQRLHRALITIICLTLFLSLLLSIYFIKPTRETDRVALVDEVAQVLAQQIANRLQPIMEEESAENKMQQVSPILDTIAKQPRILNVSVYQLNGALLAQAGEVTSPTKLDKNPISTPSYRQIVAIIEGKNAPVGFLRVTLNTQPFSHESMLLNRTSHIFLLMLLLSFMIGMLLSYAWWNGKNKASQKNLNPQDE